jgi:hypothetical protein
MTDELTGRIEAALAELPAPEQPTDGDCLTLAPLVTSILTEAGLPARTVAVWGWLGGNVAGFVHMVTLVDPGTIVDFTARQFSPDAPGRWIAPVDGYRYRLADLTGTVMVTVDRPEKT